MSPTIVMLVWPPLAALSTHSRGRSPLLQLPRTPSSSPLLPVLFGGAPSTAAAPNQLLGRGRQAATAQGGSKLDDLDLHKSGGLGKVDNDGWISANSQAVG